MMTQVPSSISSGNMQPPSSKRRRTEKGGVSYDSTMTSFEVELAVDELTVDTSTKVLASGKNDSPKEPISMSSEEEEENLTKEEAADLAFQNMLDYMP